MLARAMLGTFAVMLILYGSLLYFGVFRLLNPFARRVLIGLTILELILSALHVIFSEVFYPIPFPNWFFSLDRELTLGVFITVAQYMIVQLIALLILLRIPSLKFIQRIFWAIIILVFTWLWMDEFFALHEAVNNWRSMYIISGVIFAAVLAITLWFGYRDRLDLIIPLFLGLALMGTAGIVLDAITNDHHLIVAGREMKWLIPLSCDGIIPIPCMDMLKFSFVEEFFEMAGVSLILAGFVTYLESTQEEKGLKAVRWAIVLPFAIWLTIMFSQRWIVPAIQVASNTESAQAEYLNGALALTGYQLSSDTLTPGDELQVTLYFRNKMWLAKEYRLAVNLLNPDEGDPIAQADIELGEHTYPSNAWVPGFSVRNRVELHVPEEINAPAGYWLMVRIWDEDAELPLTATDLPQVGSGAFILLNLPVLSEAAPVLSPKQTTFTYDDGLMLSGYDLPVSATADDTLTIKFWWQTTAAGELELNQFVHLVPQQETDYGFFGYDQPPFNTNFPTSIWPADMAETATWQIALPVDLPPGSYDAYTGLYTLGDFQRRPVYINGERVPNDAIPLGEIIIKAP